MAHRGFVAAAEQLSEKLDRSRILLWHHMICHTPKVVRKRKGFPSQLLILKSFFVCTHVTEVEGWPKKEVRFTLYGTSDVFEPKGLEEFLSAFPTLTTEES